MSVDEVAQAQQAIGKTLAQAQLGEDRQLASVVREAGEQVARLFAGILRLPRLYELTNNAFVKPIESLLEQMSIQDQQVRVSGKNRDDLQEAIKLLRGTDFGIDLQFINFRD